MYILIYTYTLTRLYIIYVYMYKYGWKHSIHMSTCRCRCIYIFTCICICIDFMADATLYTSPFSDKLDKTIPQTLTQTEMSFVLTLSKNARNAFRSEFMGWKLNISSQKIYVHSGPARAAGRLRTRPGRPGPPSGICFSLLCSFGLYLPDFNLSGGCFPIFYVLFTKFK